jgi:hypothetical protein
MPRAGNGRKQEADMRWTSATARRSPKLKQFVTDRVRYSRWRLAEWQQPSLRANGSRECAPDDRLHEAIQYWGKRSGLLRRFTPRNDVL